MYNSPPTPTHTTPTMTTRPGEKRAGFFPLLRPAGWDGPWGGEFVWPGKFGWGGEFALLGLSRLVGAGVFGALAGCDVIDPHSSGIKLHQSHLAVEAHAEDQVGYPRIVKGVLRG